MKAFFDSVPGVVWQAAFTLLSAVLVWQFGDGEQIVLALGALAMVLKIVGVNVEVETQPQSQTEYTRSIVIGGAPKSKLQRVLWG